MASVTSRLVLAGALLSSVGACILVIPTPPEQYGGTCKLTEDEREARCGACLETQCQDQLDACCAENESCEPAIHDIATCETYDIGCDAPGSSSAEKALRRCGGNRCAEACSRLEDELAEEDEADASSTPRPGRVCESSGGACGCKMQDGASSSGSCDGSGLAVRCCAEAAYPDVGTQCACYPIVCETYGSSCQCRESRDKPSTADWGLSCSASGDGVCCSNGVECECFDFETSCASGFREVSRCSASDLLGCGASSSVKKVSSCN